MALLGRGVMLIWHDVTPEHVGAYHEWHSKEHIPERVAIPGFRRGHRYSAVVGRPACLDFYEVDELATLVSAPYLERLNHPTSWTTRMVAEFRNTNRTLARVVASCGLGVCPYLMTIQLAPQPGRADALASWLTGEVLPSLLDRPGVLSGHLVKGDQEASHTETEEKRLRGIADAVADWVLLVGGYDPDALQAVRNEVLSADKLTARGAAGEPTAATYRLMHSIGEPDLAT